MAVIGVCLVDAGGNKNTAWKAQIGTLFSKVYVTDQTTVALNGKSVATDDIVLPGTY
ncbi:hypothetical protein KIH79_11045 [Bifidobacterium sp. 82T10]|uniref:Uncharacterized protein n=1 Tax=Bifidobacterium miconis TaxID=2834435 RepID=A0ABS6WI67_9BIFI|nr:hypothetical protein [Bifidobacterium miconis]MBW3093445.1 hypothetical protein [Bifidobacterium miconis]